MEESNVAPHAEAVKNLLFTQPDALPRKAEPEKCGREGADGGYTVEIIDRDTPFLHIVISWPLVR